MFDSSFPFAFIHNINPTAEDLFNQAALYRCKGAKSNQVYIIRVEHYAFDIIAIKFHLKNHSESDDKYRLASNLAEVQPLLGTCIEVLLHEHTQSPFASFIVVGMNGQSEENLKNTKRYRVYKKVLVNKFSPVAFDHFDLTDCSTYCMLNKAHPHSGDALQYVEANILKILEQG